LTPKKTKTPKADKPIIGDIRQLNPTIEMYLGDPGWIPLKDVEDTLINHLRNEDIIRRQNPILDQMYNEYRTLLLMHYNNA